MFGHGNWMWKLLRILGKFPKRMDYSQRIVSMDAPERLYFKVSSLQDKNTWQTPETVMKNLI